MNYTEIFIPSYFLFCLGFQFCNNRDEENTEVPSGHVTSISVLRSYRRLGLAAKLMRQSRQLPSCHPTRYLILIFFIPVDLL
jgi:ribosomal protein S18 acetylase RimI-like enzyme